MTSEYDSGLGTTPMMWQLLSELIDGEKLPSSLDAAIVALLEGRAMLVERPPPRADIRGEPAVTFPSWVPALRNGDELRVEQAGGAVRFFVNGAEVFPPGVPPPA